MHAKVGNREQAVAELVASDDPWLKSCGAYAIGTFAIKSLEVELGKCLEYPAPLLRETARTAKLRLEAPAANSCTSRPDTYHSHSGAADDPLNKASSWAPPA